MGYEGLELSVIDGTYAICKLPANHRVPTWVPHSGLTSVTRTEDELSIVCEQSSIPTSLLEQCEANWVALKVLGPLDFSMTGVLSSLAGPLADANISIFVLSTYDTDYLLVKSDSLSNAQEALIKSGINFV